MYYRCIIRGYYGIDGCGRFRYILTVALSTMQVNSTRGLGCSTRGCIVHTRKLKFRDYLWAILNWSILHDASCIMDRYCEIINHVSFLYLCPIKRYAGEL